MCCQIDDLDETKLDAERLLHQNEQELKMKSELLSAMERSLTENARLLDSATENKNTLESDLRIMKDKLDDQEANLMSLRNKNEQMSNENELLQNEKSCLQNELSTLQDELGSVNEDRNQLKCVESKLVTQLEQLSNRNDTFAAEIQQLSEKALSADKCKLEQEEELHNLKDSFEKCNVKIVAYQNEISKLQDENSRLSRELETVQKENNDLVSQIKIESEAVELRSQLLADATDQMDQLKSEKVHLEDCLRNADSRLEDLAKKLEESEDNVEDKTSQLASLLQQLEVAKALEEKFAESQTNYDNVIVALHGIEEALENFPNSKRKLRSSQKSDSCSKNQDYVKQKLQNVMTLTLEMKQKVSSQESEIQDIQRMKFELERTLQNVTTEKEELEQNLDSLKKSERCARMDAISKLENIQKQSDSIKAKYVESENVIRARDEELRALRTSLRELNEEKGNVEIQLAEAKKENDKLCGHQNPKQKIHHHMHLKRQIDEQNQSMKSLQDQIGKITKERDNAVDECRRLQLQHGQFTVTNGKEKKQLEVPQMVRRSQVKKAPLADATTKSDNRIADNQNSLTL